MMGCQQGSNTLGEDVLAALTAVCSVGGTLQTGCEDTMKTNRYRFHIIIVMLLTDILPIPFDKFYLFIGRVHTTLEPAMSVGLSISPSSLAFSAFTSVFCMTAPAQMFG